MRFQDKVAIVTGGSSGIGKEVATRFVAEGGFVVIIGRDAAKAEAAAKEVDATGKRAIAHVGDISLPATGEAAVKAALDRFGRLDVLFNNAGIFGPKPFLDVTEDEYDRFLSVILKGKFFIAQAAAKAMKAAGRGGAIVLTGSMWALQAIGATPSSAYSAANGGVHALVKNLAIELAPDKIRVNAIAPGVIETPVFSTFLTPEQVKTVLPTFNAMHPLGRNGQPADAAEALLFLASDQASFITAVVLPVDVDNKSTRTIEMYMQVQKKLFTPVQIGPITLKHRVVMPPMSRLRAQWPRGIPSDLMREYYSQRASDGGVILTEATAISPSGRGYRGAPCLYRDEQVTGWKRITDAVHANGGYMFVQLWHAGRTTHVAVTGEQPVTASVDPAYWADPNIFVVTPDGFSRPSPHRALETAEISVIVEQYRTAAVNAKRAGFDGVDVMAANGHLIEQFLQDNSNKRTDRYGGSIENRTRLLVEVVEALVPVWDADRVGVRIAPSGTYNGMGDSDPRALFRYVAERLNVFGLAYLHVIEPRINGADLVAEGQGAVAAQELSKIFQNPMIASGGFEPDTAEATVANGDASLIAFGRHFIANPDLPKRIELGLPLNHYDRSTFYAFDARGYIDYPAYEVQEADQTCVD